MDGPLFLILNKLPAFIMQFGFTIASVTIPDNLF